MVKSGKFAVTVRDSLSLLTCRPIGRNLRRPSPGWDGPSLVGCPRRQPRRNERKPTLAHGALRQCIRRINRHDRDCATRTRCRNEIWKVRRKLISTRGRNPLLYPRVRSMAAAAPPRESRRQGAFLPGTQDQRLIQPELHLRTASQKLHHRGGSTRG